MERYFAGDYQGAAFELFGLHHTIMLAIFVVLVFGIYRLGQSQNLTLQNRVRIGLALILILQEIAFHVWNISIGSWSVQTRLPFHVCSALVWLSPVMLLTRSYRIYELAFFIGIGGALQAMLTPDISQYGFPHFRFFQVFISHGSIILAALYMTFVDKFRPTWKSLWRVFWGLNAYMMVMYGINTLLGSNYLFIMHKPETPSLLDVLGPWPWYVFAAEGLAVMVFFLLYLPFWLQGRITAKIPQNVSTEG